MSFSPCSSSIPKVTETFWKALLRSTRSDEDRVAAFDSPGDIDSLRVPMILDHNRASDDIDIIVDWVKIFVGTDIDCRLRGSSPNGNHTQVQKIA